jgi:hypothetical protein
VTVLRWLRVQWDRALAVTLFGVGVVFLVAGWVGISGEVFAARQLPYILSGGIGGLFLLGAAATLWLSADMRDEWHQLRRIEQRMAAGESLPAPPRQTPGESLPAAPAQTAVREGDAAPDVPVVSGRRR